MYHVFVAQLFDPFLIQPPPPAEVEICDLLVESTGGFTCPHVVRGGENHLGVIVGKLTVLQIMFDPMRVISRITICFCCYPLLGKTWQRKLILSNLVLLLFRKIQIFIVNIIQLCSTFCISTRIV